jgi:hypothetical protein
VSFFPARTGVHACEFGESPNNWENREKRSAKRSDLGPCPREGMLAPFGSGSPNDEESGAGDGKFFVRFEFRRQLIG